MLAATLNLGLSASLASTLPNKLPLQLFNPQILSLKHLNILTDGTRTTEYSQAKKCTCSSQVTGPSNATLECMYTQEKETLPIKTLSMYTAPF